MGAGGEEVLGLGQTSPHCLAARVNMVSTHTANKTMHPGEPDMPQPRRTSCQVQIDKTISDSQKEAAVQAHRTKTEAVAALRDRMAAHEATAVRNTVHQSVPATPWVARPLIRTDTVLIDHALEETTNPIESERLIHLSGH